MAHSLTDPQRPPESADEDPTAATVAAPAQGDPSWLSPGVVGVSAASFFSDSGHEIATSLLPSFLTSVLHAGPGALGVVEGTSDALIGLSKLAGGPLASNPDHRGRL